MSEQIRVFDKVYAPIRVDYINAQGWIHGDPDSWQPEDLIPDSPALPAIAAWLQAHPEAKDYFKAMVTFDAYPTPAMFDCLRALVAALGATGEEER